MRWDDLGLLLALSRAGTLSSAAESLGVNTSTVARRLDAMEEELDVHLFDRTPAGIAATELAEALFPIAESMESAAADAMRVVAERETEPEGVVRLTAPPGLANWFVAPLLVRLRERHPKLRIELEATVGYADLTRREADLALRTMRPSSGDLVSVRLAEAESLVAAAPELVQRVGKLKRLEDIDWINWADDLAHLPDARWIGTQVPKDNIVLTTSSMDAQLQAARSGLGALLLPRAFLEWVGLAALPLAPSLAKRLPAMPRGSLWLVGHRALRDVPRVHAVWDFIVEQIQLFPS